MANKNLYFTDEQAAQVTELMETLEAQGVELRDQRGILSISALFRYLIEKERKKVGLVKRVKP